MYASSRYSLISGLSCDVSPRAPLDLCHSEGSLYLEQDVTVTVTVVSSISAGAGAMAGTLSLGAQGQDWSRCGEGLEADPGVPASQLGTVVVYGVSQRPTSVTLADGRVLYVGDSYSDAVFYEVDTGRLQVSESALDLCQTDKLQMSWNF